MSNIDYRELLDRIAKVIEVDGEEQGGYHYADLPSLVRQYGTACNRAGQSLISRHRQEDVDQWKASLPEPDATNPDHLRWVASVLHKAEEGLGCRAGLWAVGGWAAVTKHVDAEADRLDTARSAERVREQRIEQAARTMYEAEAECCNLSQGWERTNLRDAFLRNARALDAAGLLRGE